MTNPAARDAAPRRRGSLAVWSTDTAIAAWKAEPSTTRGGQPRCPSLATGTAPALLAAFRPALRQTEGSTGSILARLDPDLAVPDRPPLSRRAKTSTFPAAQPGPSPMRLLADSAGLTPCGPGEWPLETHGTKTRRSWRKLHIGADPDTRPILAATPSFGDVDDASQIGTLLNQADPVASFTADAVHGQNGVQGEVARHSPGATVIAPPRSAAVPSEAAGTVPTQRDRHLRMLFEQDRRGWQKSPGRH